MESDVNKTQWKQISCLEERMDLEIPGDLKRPSNEVIEKKFPYNVHPQEIFINPEISRILTLEMLEKPLRDIQVYPAIMEIQRLIRHIYPESIRKAARILQVSAGKAGTFTFITGSVKGDMAHCMFILPFHESMMLGGYHYPVENEAEEQASILRILQSMRVRSTEEKELKSYAENRVYG